MHFFKLNAFLYLYFFQGALTREAFQAQRVFLWKAAGMAKPNDTELANLLKTMSEKIEAVQVRSLYYLILNQLISLIN